MEIQLKSVGSGKKTQNKMKFLMQKEFWNLTREMLSGMVDDLPTDTASVFVFWAKLGFS